MFELNSLRWLGERSSSGLVSFVCFPVPFLCLLSCLVSCVFFLYMTSLMYPLLDRTLLSQQQ